MAQVNRYSCQYGNKGGKQGHGSIVHPSVQIHHGIRPCSFMSWSWIRSGRTRKRALMLSGSPLPRETRSVEQPNSLQIGKSTGDFWKFRAIPAFWHDFWSIYTSRFNSLHPVSLLLRKQRSFAQKGKFLRRTENSPPAGQAPRCTPQRCGAAGCPDCRTAPCRSAFARKGLP